MCIKYNIAKIIYYYRLVAGSGTQTSKYLKVGSSLRWSGLVLRNRSETGRKGERAQKAKVTVTENYSLFCRIRYLPDFGEEGRWPKFLKFQLVHELRRFKPCRGWAQTRGSWFPRPALNVLIRSRVF
jgi:hypothetical protein